MGGQAEFLRAPWADFNALRLPEDAEEKVRLMRRRKLKAAITAGACNAVTW